MSEHQLILASASPRRSELLARMGVRFIVHPADVDESQQPAEMAEDYVRRMADTKASRVAAARGPYTVVLAADTVVVCDGDLLGKPQDRDDALKMLSRLSGRRHRVLSAVSLQYGHNRRQVLTDSEVEFRRLERAECEAYWDTGEPRDKAGAYAIQGLGGCFVTAVFGSYSGIVGLPMAETLALLRTARVPCGPEAVRRA